MAWMSDTERDKLLERLLKPAPGENPAGPDARTDADLRPDYDRFEAAFEELVRFERKCQEARQFNSPDRPPQPKIAFDGKNATEVYWPEVIRRGCQLLESSKNLVVATRVAEACLYQYSLEGLQVGLDIVKGLCEKYWDCLYPLPDPDDLRDGELTCLIPLRRFGGKSARDLLQSRLELTSQHSTLLDLEIARTTTGAAAASIKSLDDLRQEFSQTPKDRLLDLHARAASANATCETLQDLLQKNCAAMQPHPIALPSGVLQPLCGALDGVCGAIREFAPPGVFPDEPQVGTTSENAQDTPSAATPSAGATLSVGGAPQHRAAALEQLRKVAEFFRKTEPHSPVSYAIEQAIRWGGLSLPQLLAELIESEDTRTAFFKRAGIPQPPSEQS